MDENQDLISLHPFELAQNFKNHFDIWASYPFFEIELELESDLEPQVSDSISLFDSVMIPVSLSDFYSLPESRLNHVPVHHEIESLISYDHTSLWEKCVNINSLVWAPFLNQFRLSLLTLYLI